MAPQFPETSRSVPCERAQGPSASRLLNGQTGKALQMAEASQKLLTKIWREDGSSHSWESTTILQNLKGSFIEP